VLLLKRGSEGNSAFGVTEILRENLSISLGWQQQIKTLSYSPCLRDSV